MKHKLTTTLLLTILSLHLIAETKVTHCPEEAQSLAKKIKWAEQTIKKMNADSDVWIGYSIKKEMRKNSWTGSFHHDGRNRRSLRELLNGIGIIHDDTDNASLLDVARNAFDKEDDMDNPLVMKDMAFLFRIPEGEDRLVSATNLKITNLSLHVNLKDLPLLWLHETTHNESLDLLTSVYPQMRNEDEQQGIILAVSLHDNENRVFSFLEDRINSNESEELREDAVFWLGQTDHKRALPILRKTVHNDRSEEVREKAVFSISQMDLEAAEDLLIDLAYHADPKSIRKKAVFWLGQKASEKATKTLKDVAFNSEETEVQNHAVFALSQQDNDIAVPALMKIAKTHPNPKIRKKAIFWLGETGDPRVVDMLVELVKN